MCRHKFKLLHHYTCFGQNNLHVKISITVKRQNDERIGDRDLSRKYE